MWPWGTPVGGFTEELTELLKPKIFDHIALEIAPELPDETRDFITRLYEDFKAKDADDIVDVEGNSLAIRYERYLTVL